MPAPKRQQGQSISKHDEAIDDYIASLEAALDSTRLEVDELRAALRNLIAWEAPIELAAPELGGALRAFYEARAVLERK